MEDGGVLCVKGSGLNKCIFSFSETSGGASIVPTPVKVPVLGSEITLEAMIQGKKIRCFTAIWPSDEVLRSLEAVKQYLGGSVHRNSIRWISSEQIHLTLNFPGSLEIAVVEELQRLLVELIPGRSGFLLEARGLGVFPPSGPIEVLWAGVGGEIEALIALQAQLAHAFGRIGVRAETRTFHPHLTLGRGRHLKEGENKAIRKAMAGRAGESWGTWRVKKIDLMMSQLSPKGPSYEKIASYELQSA